MTNLKTASEWATILTAGGSGLAAIFYLGKWTVLWMIRQDRAADRIETMQTNHLPHIYRVLRLICKKLDIDLEGIDGQN